MRKQRSKIDMETNKYKAFYRRELSTMRLRRGKKFCQCHSTICDLIGDPLHWPEKICSLQKKMRVGARRDFRRMLVAPTLKFAERHKLTLFLVGNGVSPAIVRSYYEAAGNLSDESARRQIEYTLNIFERGDRNQIDRFWCFDLIRGRWERMG